MKEGIHPTIYQAKVKCACGEEFVTGSTVEEIHVDICSKCHPFYTGKQKFIDSAGRIDKFNKKYAKANNNKQ
ncbi:MAG: 50S ribosomal protein L31 [bacterium]